MQLQGDLVMKKTWTSHQIEIHFQIKLISKYACEEI